MVTQGWKHNLEASPLFFFLIPLSKILQNKLWKFQQILKAQGSCSAGSLQEGRCALPLPSMLKAAKVSWGCQQASSCFPLLWVIPRVNNARKDLHLAKNWSCRLYSASLCHVPSTQPSSKLCFAPLKYFPTRSGSTLQN